MGNTRSQKYGKYSERAILVCLLWPIKAEWYNKKWRPNMYTAIHGGKQETINGITKLL